MIARRATRAMQNTRTTKLIHNCKGIVPSNRQFGKDVKGVEHEHIHANLNGFAAHICDGESLCFFYAKHVPFVEATGRILIGAGRVKGKGALQEYRREGEGIRGMIWERPIQHSIRPKGGEGFLFP